MGLLKLDITGQWQWQRISFTLAHPFSGYDITGQGPEKAPYIPSGAGFARRSFGLRRRGWMRTRKGTGMCSSILRRKRVCRKSGWLLMIFDIEAVVIVEICIFFFEKSIVCHCYVREESG